ncbi:MAG: hypothetical protein JRL30_07950 [Deltaproteobacteria bacterium]|nr:hypothetical protein [Deltaproteobacteria bacterium]
MTQSTVTPSAPIPASTIILIRHREEPMQVYLLKRSSRCDFMPGNYVFPGGTVDSEDKGREFWKKHIDMDSGQVKNRLSGGLNIEDAMAHGIAAIRETFEEAGILLAHGDHKGDRNLEQLREHRYRHRLPKAWLREQVLLKGWTLTFSGLAPWSHWITPKARSKRYDTRFFMAFMPEDQECRPDNRETTHGIWITPEKALQGNLKGKVPLSPPAVVTMQELLCYSDVGALKREVKTRAWGEEWIPRLVRTNAGGLLLLPWDPQYTSQEIKEDTRGLEKRKAPVGTSFSRLWYNGGIWMPLTP